MDHRATYSPDDNKIRLYPAYRLDKETYLRLKAAGFAWAPKQELFVAPMWTPEREDLARELAGEIEDEDTSLVDRAAQRADRFEGYSDKRLSEAESTRASVSRLADAIPLGQPILVGHHSEKHARRDAERIQNGMAKAVRLWDTSKYWTMRAEGAIHHAKYKELPAVRARRIKGLEAERRKYERNKDTAALWLRAWTREDITLEQARLIASRCYMNVAHDGQFRWTAWDVLRPEDERPSAACPVWTVEQVQAVARERFPRMIAMCERWLAHIDNRLSYERAMLAESGWTATPKRKTSAALPLLNYSGNVSYRNPYTRETVTAEAVPVTKATFARINKDYKGTRVSACGTHRVRTAINVPGYGHALVIVYISDSKQHARPDAATVAKKAAEEQEGAERAADALARQALARHEAREAKKAEREEEDAKDAPFEALKASAAGGVTVAVAPQLFPTPGPLAVRMVELADVEHGHAVLEPSAGTGMLLDAIRAAGGVATAVELHCRLAEGLRRRGGVVHATDFLTCSPEDLGLFDRIVMNPPFEHAADVAHIQHALTFLKPGGRLVALCANGPRQNERLGAIADTWEELPPDTFKAQGTTVRAVLLSVTR